MHKRFLPLIAVFGMAFFIFQLFQEARIIGSSDISRSILAGATNILNGETYLLQQRPPVYSGVLAALGMIIKVDPLNQLDMAQESGNIIRLQVVKGFMETPFLKGVLILNLLFWIGSIFIYLRILGLIDVNSRLRLFSILLFVIPSAWIGTSYVIDSTLTSLLIVSSIYFYCIWLFSGFPHSWPALITAIILFSIAGLTRAAYQLLPFFMLIPIGMIFLKHDKRRFFQGALLTIIISTLIIGGWSLRNKKEHGFLGVSVTMGVSLSTRTAFFMQEGVGKFPEYDNIFVQLRDQRFAHSTTHLPNLWGEDASRWLISEKNMSYAQANSTLTAYNLNAIRNAPLNYLAAGLQSLIGFHFPNIPDWPTPIRLILTPLEFFGVGIPVLSLMLWFGLHVVRALKPKLVNFGDWGKSDSLIAICTGVYVYSALIHCFIDQGTSYQRLSLVPTLFLITTAIISRLKLFTDD